MNTFKIRVENNKVMGTRLDESEVEEGWIVVEDYPQELIFDPFHWYYINGEFVFWSEEEQRQDALVREKQRRLGELKTNLANTDYIITKITEAQTLGNYVVADLIEEYNETLQNRMAWREEINILERELN